MGFWGWIGFDIFTLIASYLSSVSVSAQTIMRTLGLLTFMVPMGLSTATNVLIG
jgi:Na+-driven multidrug efflux pump